MVELSVFADPTAFLQRAEPWLLEHEDRHNLILSLAAARASAGSAEPDSFWCVLEREGSVVGCAMRTPPHKLLVTDLPIEAASLLAVEAAARYQEMPAVLGPSSAAEAVAVAWVAARGGGWHPGMEQGIYRLDRVEPPRGVPGELRAATPADVALALEWGEGFSRDAGIGFPTKREVIDRWIAEGALHLWTVDGAPVSIAVAQGRTRRGVRIGYVYTPPEQRRHGYASACVAALSQKMLDAGVDFCVLYTDLSNPTSNAIYQRVGYYRIVEVRDYDLIPEGVA